MVNFALFIVDKIDKTVIRTATILTVKFYRHFRVCIYI